MPASATAAAIVDADSFAASYLTCSRCPIRSAEKSSRPARCLKRRSISATSSRQSIPSTLKVDSAWSSQTAQTGTSALLAVPTIERRLRVRVRRPRGRRGECGGALLHVLEALREQPDDVVVVEGVEDHLPGPARPDQPHPAKKPELVRDGRLARARAAPRCRRRRARLATARRECERVSRRRGP